MIDNARNWFSGLSQRERLLVGVAGLLLVGLVGYYGVARPMVGAMSASEDRYMNAVEQQGRIEAKVAALLQPVQGTTVKFSGAIDNFVSQSAGETGIAVGSINPQSDSRVNMVVESAKPTALFGWLARIEREGIAVENLNVDPAGNGTVSATLTLRSH
ncbi:type II secretion system protein GspM [Parasphingorhabdus flavimaris]|jgi:general secretion pathway protein M|uniref:Type II secretion system protein M n=1 Tax=Parasphingorhabdus flavimaris TaxID=266812 RepID=A0ABX2N434_9SPHN|nr:type II secretion system protein GspM [Parasphingorhabdus flavimaris]NVD28475.1 type II secretion system protein M [Parasphingorhabdus flavimaris]|tara:strand:+ start:27578 stop:28051 length:474 start_codon:yes stop_codon:yes gene_type:complete